MSDTKKYYIIAQSEKWQRVVKVQANSQEEALEKLRSGDDVEELEYTFSDIDWTCVEREIIEKEVRKNRG